MFSFRKKKKSPASPSRFSRKNISEQDLQYIVSWVDAHSGVEGYIEPETFVNEMSIVLVDAKGEWTRRTIGGESGVKAILRATGISIFSAEEEGYPQRMRDRIDRDRLLEKRREQAERRARRHKQNQPREEEGS